MKWFILSLVALLALGCQQDNDNIDQNQAQIICGGPWVAVTESGAHFAGEGETIINLPHESGCLTVSKTSGDNGDLTVQLLPPLQHSVYTHEPFGQVKACPR